MKIISKYILREHVGPFAFALTALTSLMILNFISRQFGELVGKGLPSSVIAEFFMLSIPFTVALTLPMSVLVAVLYAFSRLAAENEVTALKASGVSPWRLVTPALVAGLVMSFFLLWFNDQVLPRANHRLKTLQDDISQTKPTLLLKPQVINAISEGRFYLKAGRIDRSSSRMREVVIYDLSNPTRRRTIFADSGLIQFAANGKDLELELFNGQMQEVATDKPTQLDRLFYDRDLIRIPDVANNFTQSKSDSANRGDRELGVCAMQKRLRLHTARYQEARNEYQEALRLAKLSAAERTPRSPMVPSRRMVVEEPHNLGWAYCQVLSRLIGVKAAQAADVRSAGLHPVVQDTTPRQAIQDTTPKGAAQDTATNRAAQDSVARRDSARRASADSAARAARAAAAPTPAGAGRQTVILGTSTPNARGASGVAPAPVPVQSSPSAAAPAQTFKDPFLAKTASESAAAIMKKNRVTETEVADNIARTVEVRMRYEAAQRTKNRYEVEINKKFSLAAACLIFVILGAPLALRFPRGGVGLVLLVSLIVFALYYVGLIGGESLANKGIIDPFWAMWGTNVVLTAAGLVLLLRMGREESSGRGGNWGDRLDRVRDALRRRRRRQPMLAKEAA